MADPERAWTTRDLELDGTRVPADEPVWVHRRGDRWTEIEFSGRRGRVPTDALSAHEVRGPSLAQLRDLDPCFGLPDEAFQQIHIDPQNYFEILRCRAHGRRFLSDVVGGFAWVTRLTLLSEDDDEDPYQVWRRYHDQSWAWHARRGRTL